ncbi:MAG TPA: hypothetical protein VIA62_00100 [Thermoanaerobaculia bacterium]|jgi:hypothetical protein|nr:hypothetical protein [Thermoanaerobaculia bacterium]
MKKTTKKLSLNRETLRNLAKGTLHMPVGGAVTQIDCTQLANGSCFSTHPTCFCTRLVPCPTTP